MQEQPKPPNEDYWVPASRVPEVTTQAASATGVRGTASSEEHPARRKRDTRPLTSANVYIRYVSGSAGDLLAKRQGEALRAAMKALDLLDTNQSDPAVSGDEDRDPAATSGLGGS